MARTVLVSPRWSATAKENAADFGSDRSGNGGGSGLAAGGSARMPPSSKNAAQAFMGLSSRANLCARSLHLGQVRRRRAVHELSVGRVARPVARAVPGLFARVPVDDAAHVRADGR